MIIALAIRWIVLRRGGIRTYRRWLPFFLGLILGDFLMGSVWSLLSIITGTRLYQYYP